MESLTNEKLSSFDTSALLISNCAALSSNFRNDILSLISLPNFSNIQLHSKKSIVKQFFNKVRWRVMYITVYSYNWKMWFLIVSLIALLIILSKFVLLSDTYFGLAILAIMSIFSVFGFIRKIVKSRGEKSVLVRKSAH